MHDYALEREARMSNPRIAAIVTGLVVLWTGYDIFFAGEAPSQTLAILQWVIFVAALVGFVGSLFQIARR